MRSREKNALSVISKDRFTNDFVYSSVPQTEGNRVRHPRPTHHHDSPELYEYHGEWGFLLVGHNPYNGFQPVENARHIFVVIGGPVLCFRDNRFLTGEDPRVGTQAIYDRWRAGAIRWDEDLSGPFAVLAVDKASKKVSCITDLMAFIPVYQYARNGTTLLATHVDVLAQAAGETANLDLVSLADFILNGVVTYPYTSYAHIRQCHPAAVHVFEACVSPGKPIAYWMPEETNPYSDIKHAANALREGLLDYVNRATEGMTSVAQFISAGEDSRVVCGLLPQRLKRDAFVFLDNMNREGLIAKRVTEAYGACFDAQFRGKAHYLDILPKASALVGSGHQYTHAHALGFDESCGLGAYSAVFGGFLSDTFLKGHFVKQCEAYGIFPFLPQSQRAQCSPVGLRIGQGGDVFSVCSKILERQEEHLARIFELRPHSADEWFNIWPLSMHDCIPNVYCNRRLFRSYEPFLCKQAVKIGAAVPTDWKLNRRLFNKAVRPYLKPSRWICHGNGHLPYFPWWVNVGIQFAVWGLRHVAKRFGRGGGNQGPWVDWKVVMKSREWQEGISKNSSGFESIRPIVKAENVETMFRGHMLSRAQKVNLLQVLYAVAAR